jgi:hypothetical protein
MPAIKNGDQFRKVFKSIVKIMNDNGVSAEESIPLLLTMAGCIVTNLDRSKGQVEALEIIQQNLDVLKRTAPFTDPGSHKRN